MGGGGRFVHVLSRTVAECIKSYGELAEAVQGYSHATPNHCASVYIHAAMLCCGPVLAAARHRLDAQRMTPHAACVPRQEAYRTVLHKTVAKVCPGLSDGSSGEVLSDTRKDKIRKVVDSYVKAGNGP